MSSKEIVDHVLKVREGLAQLKEASSLEEKSQALKALKTSIEGAKVRRQSEENAVAKEVATISPGAKVSWTDHLGRFSGTVEEVHFTKVTRPVRLLRAYRDSQEHSVTRVGTYNNPVLYIRIDGSSLESEDAGMALVSLRHILQVDEDPNNGMGR